MLPDRSRLISLKDAAKLICVSRSKLYRMVQRREVEHHRIGGTILFSDENIDELLRESKKERREASVKRKTPRLPILKHVRL